jgi:DNA polymerase III subunit epsilon
MMVTTKKLIGTTKEIMMNNIYKDIEKVIGALEALEADLTRFKRVLANLALKDDLPTLPTVIEQPVSSLKNFVEMARQNKFLVLDTETTGLNDGEVCQIAIINQDGEVLLNSHVKTVYPIPADASRIHGITDDTVKDAPTWAEIAPRVREIIQGQDLIVYNAVYDRKMMHKSAEYAAIEKIEWKEVARWWCAMTAYAEFHGDWNDYRGNYRWQKLATAAARFGVSSDGWHDALADVRMTLGVVKGLVNVGV